MPPIRYCSFALALALAAPAHAGWWASGDGGAGTEAASGAAKAPRPATKPHSVPEPADFALFAAGVVGLLLGRRGSRSRRD